MVWTHRSWSDRYRVVTLEARPLLLKGDSKSKAAAAAYSELRYVLIVEGEDGQDCWSVRRSRLLE
jgi:hypothetical protein